MVAVCLPDSLDLTPSGYRFCFGQAPGNRALAESCDFAFVGAVEISSLRYHYDIDLHDTIVLQRKVSPLRNVYYICPIYVYMSYIYIYIHIYIHIIYMYIYINYIHCAPLKNTPKSF